MQLLEDVDGFLSSDESMLALLGEPGAGKSLFSWYSSQSRLHTYQALAESTELDQTPWVPLVIELKYYKLSDLKDIIPRYLKLKETCDLSDAEITALQTDTKTAHRLMIVFDGFDELKQDASDAAKLFTDLYASSGAKAWRAGQVKTIVTCRVRHLPDEHTERTYFGVGARDHYRRRILLSFRSSQMAEYLLERTSKGEGEHLLSATEYEAVLEQSPSLKEMVRNPFVMRLYVDALPSLKAQGKKLRETI